MEEKSKLSWKKKFNYKTLKSILEESKYIWRAHEESESGERQHSKNNSWEFSKVKKDESLFCKSQLITLT